MESQRFYYRLSTTIHGRVQEFRGAFDRIKKLVMPDRIRKAEEAKTLMETSALIIKGSWIGGGHCRGPQGTL